MKKSSVILKKVHFDWENPEISLTSLSQGGAASLKNDMYLTKADKAIESDLDEEQQKILKEIGEEFVPLQKSKEDNKNAPSSSDNAEGSTGEESDVNKGKYEDMAENSDQDLQKQLDDKESENKRLLRELSISKAEKLVMSFSFNEEIEKGLTSALAELSEEHQGSIIKALDTLKDKTDSITKAKEKENSLDKSLLEEQGHDAKEESVQKSFAEQVIEAKARQKGGK